MERVLSYGRQCLDEDDARAVAAVLRGDFLTQGPLVEEFERAVAARIGVPYAVAVANGTVALHLAVAALGLPAGFTGLTSPITFAASANAFLYAGGRPAFADVGPDFPNLSPAAVDAWCRKNPPPSVVIPVSYAGVPADLPGFRRLADRHGFKLIEDACHALGSTYAAGGERMPSGSSRHSDLAVFSFHPVKNITTAEGGMITTGDKALYETLCAMRHHGICRDPARMRNRDLACGADGTPNPWYYEVHSLGWNGRLSELHAALGLSQLKKLDAFKAARGRIVRRYDEAFAGRDDLAAPVPPPHLEADPFFHLYPLVLRGPDAAGRRGRLFRRLMERGVRPQVHYVPLHLQPHFRALGLPCAGLPNAERFYDGEISLPLHPALAPEDQERVIATCLEFLDGEERGR